MRYFKYSVLENNRLFANFDDGFLKDSISLAKTIKSMRPDNNIKVVENNKYPTIHGYHPITILSL